MLNEHYVLKNLFFYEVTRLVNSEARQACLEQQEKKMQRRDVEASSGYKPSDF